MNKNSDHPSSFDNNTTSFPIDVDENIENPKALSISHYRNIIKDFFNYLLGIIKTRKSHLISVKYLLAFKNMHRFSNGLTTDLFSFLTKNKKSQDKYIFNDLSNVVSSNEVNLAKQAKSGIKKDGYFVFPHRIDSELIEELKTFSLNQPAELCPKLTDGTTHQVFNPDAPQTNRYNFGDADLSGLSAVKTLSRAYLFRSIAEAYIGRPPVLSAVNMWWTAVGSKTPSSAAAQYFHYDYSHPKWLKFFVYLTDVNTNSGPHCLIPGSHKSDKMGAAFRKPNRSRIKDSEIESAYPGKYLELCGPAGTISVVDTRCWHKGKMPTLNNRLIFELYFTSHGVGDKLPDIHTSIFGNNDKLASINNFEKTSNFTLVKD